MPTEEFTAIALLREELVGLRQDIRTYSASEKKLRRIVRALAVSVAFDIALSVGLYIGYRKANDAANAATKSSSTQLINCRSSNQAKDIEKKLWATVLSFPPPANETPSAKATREAQTKQFQAYLDTAFSPADCIKLTGAALPDLLCVIRSLPWHCDRPPRGGGL